MKEKAADYLQKLLEKGGEAALEYAPEFVRQAAVAATAFYSAAVLVSLIVVVVGAALLVRSWQGKDDEDLQMAFGFFGAAAIFGGLIGVACSIYRLVTAVLAPHVYVVDYLVWLTKR